MKLTRRMFVGTAVGGTLLFVGGTTVALYPRGRGAGLQALSDGEMATLRAMCASLYPAHATGIGADDVKVAEKVDAYLAGFFTRERELTRLMLRLMDLRAKASEGSRFALIDDNARVRLLREWETSSGIWSLGVGAVRLLTAMFFFQDPRVMRAYAWGMGCAADAPPAPPVSP